MVQCVSRHCRSLKSLRGFCGQESVDGAVCHDVNVDRGKGRARSSDQESADAAVDRNAESLAGDWDI